MQNSDLAMYSINRLDKRYNMAVTLPLTFFTLREKILKVLNESEKIFV